MTLEKLFRRDHKSFITDLSIPSFVVFFYTSNKTYLEILLRKYPLFQYWSVVSKRYQVHSLPREENLAAWARVPISLAGKLSHTNY